jgi:hypothetical protein
MHTIKPTKSGFAGIAVPHPKQTEYLIDGIPRVRVRVGARGVLAFSLVTRVNGKVKRVAMHVGDLSKSGVMGALLEAETHAEIEADVGEVNLQSVGNAVIVNSDIAAGTARNYRTSLTRLVEVLGTRLTGSAGELTEAHRRISAVYGPVSANNALKLYRRVLNYANAAFNTKIEWPTEKLRVLGLWNKEQPREGRVAFGDMPAVWAAADKMPDPWGRLLKFYLLTGLRNTEPFKGIVDGNDFVIEDTKNHTTHRLPMTGAMSDLYADGFGVHNGRHVTEHLEKLTGLHLTPHDLRRSFAAIANHAGVPDYTISMLMNHKKTDITGRYVGRNRNSMELALLTIEQAIGKMIEEPVESMFDADDRSIEARLGRIREAQDRARKRR